VGALVFADGAAAGEIWWAPSARCQVAEVRILGPSIRRLHAGPAPTPRGRDETYDRQARLFGDAGQDLLRTLKVGIIGAGGVGALLVEYLAHLGIGWLVIADPDRLDITNLPRMPGATRWDARTWLTRAGRPAWLQRLGKRMAIPKARLAHRLARTAAPASRIDTLCGDITDGQVANHFIDCDYLFLAADTHQARLVFNALVHQFLIPGVQLGAKVPVEAATGAVGEPFSVYRPVTPSSGCLWCNGLISPERLQQEATTAQERVAQQYVPDEAVVAPSVITLNAVAASHAANDALFALTGLTRPEAHSDYVRLLHRSRDVRFDRPRRDLSCLECGIAAGSRFARGQGAQLPTRE